LPQNRDQTPTIGVFAINLSMVESAADFNSNQGLVEAAIAG
jgi:hypothetical protein